MLYGLQKATKEKNLMESPTTDREEEWQKERREKMKTVVKIDKSIPYLLLDRYIWWSERIQQVEDLILDLAHGTGTVVLGRY